MSNEQTNHSTRLTLNLNPVRPELVTTRAVIAFLNSVETIYGDGGTPHPPPWEGGAVQ